jgi:hypothetical protein
MAAGLGFKDFVTGEVLTAADVDGYLMQNIWVFASAAARDAAVTAPAEGNFAYLKDTNVTTYYTGSAWANLDTTGMTNPMTTTGDTIYSSSGSTPARLGIGTAGQVLTVNSGATAPEWKTPAGGGGKVLQVVSATTSTATTIATTTFTDTTLTATITPTSATSKILILTTQQMTTERGIGQYAQAGGIKLLRGATVVYTPATIGFLQYNTDWQGSGEVGKLRGLVSLSYLDSPATTSATTYKTQGAVVDTSNNGQVKFQHGGADCVGSIILLEIGA